MLLGGTIISTVEFHGNMSLVIFLATCPLKCPYCHNGELLDGGVETSLRSISKTIDDSADFLDAVVLSGGEPLTQVNDLIDILKYARSIGLKTKLDTAGIYPERLEQVLDLVDYVAMDIKAPFNKYKEVIGADVGDKVKKSMELVASRDDVTLECRTTFVPALLTKNDICQITKEINCDIYTLQQFRNRNVLDKSLEEVESPNAVELKKLAISLKQSLPNITVKVKTSEFGEEIINK